jgi:hypothetical protein
LYFVRLRDSYAQVNDELETGWGDESCATPVTERIANSILKTWPDSVMISAAGRTITLFGGGMSFEEDIDRALTEAGVPFSGQVGDCKGAVVRIKQLADNLAFFENVIRNLHTFSGNIVNKIAPRSEVIPEVNPPHTNGTAGAAEAAPEKKKGGRPPGSKNKPKNPEAAAAVAAAVAPMQAPVTPPAAPAQQPMENLGALVDNLNKRGFDVGIPTVAAWTSMQRSIAELWIQQGGSMPDWLEAFKKAAPAATAGDFAIEL